MRGSHLGADRGEHAAHVVVCGGQVGVEDVGDAAVRESGEARFEVARLGSGARVVAAGGRLPQVPEHLVDMTQHRERREHVVTHMRLLAPTPTGEQVLRDGLPRTEAIEAEASAKAASAQVGVDRAGVVGGEMVTRGAGRFVDGEVRRAGESEGGAAQGETRRAVGAQVDRHVDQCKAPHTSIRCSGRESRAMEETMSSRFPKASRYHPDWIRASVSGGANSLWLTEWLTSAMELRAGMRILDLGCGRGASSVFLHNEFGVQVWATDLWFPVDERLQRVRDAGVEHAVVPIHADARSLPFARGVLRRDRQHRLVPVLRHRRPVPELPRPIRQAGRADRHRGRGSRRRGRAPVPAHLAAWWEPSMACLHTADWWRRHWERSGVVDVVLADTMPDGWQLWREWQRIVAPDNAVEIETITADAGRHLGYVRAVARRRSDVEPDPPITTVPVSYRRHPVFGLNHTLPPARQYSPSARSRNPSSTRNRRRVTRSTRRRRSTS